ncbi:MAG: Glucokinase [Cyanobacteriota bacterium]
MAFSLPLQRQVIGIDIGGSSIKFGRFLANGDCLQSFALETPQPSLPKAVYAQLAIGIDQIKTPDCAAIGVGMPGPADAQGRIAQLAINLPQWHNVPLADWLEDHAQLPTILENDANCAGLGEAWLGAGKNYHDFILLTLGTGVGGAVFLNGQLFTGRHGAGGELGLISIETDGYPCNSGNRGSLEQHASAQTLRRELNMTGLELYHLAQQGDDQAIAYWEKFGQRLGIGLANLIYVLTPEAVIIGGGLSASADYFFPSMQSEIEERVLPPSRQGLEILVAQLGNRAGMIGAARLAWQKLGA